MTTYELYINNILCDLSDDSAITLLYQSPIFSGLDIIQSNRSYNIALPITPTNRNAIKFAERPDIASDAPYVKLSASLYQDGMPLFTNGYAVITDITDTINITLTWGNVDNFQPLFDASLRDLGPQLEEMGIAHIEWSENLPILGPNASNPGVAYWGVDFGMGLSNPKYIHPSVKASSIISAIEKYNGITIEGKERLASDNAPGPIIPLVSKTGDKASGKAERTVCTLVPKNSNGYTILSLRATNIYPEYLVNNMPDISGCSEVRIDVHLNFKREFVYDLYHSLACRILSSSDYSVILGEINVKKSALVEGGEMTVSIDGSVLLSKATGNLPEDGSFVVTIATKELSSYIPIFDGVVRGATVVFYGTPRDQVHFPSIFPVAANLPSISQGDFILALMSMNGLFAYADKDSPNTIKLISIDDIMANVVNGKIIDWSNRAILNEAQDISRPESSDFTIDELAQKNTLDYDNDDDVRADTSGIIKVDNVNIEKEADLVELPFSASENTTAGGISCALIPIYKDDGNGGVRYSVSAPRILAWETGQVLNNAEISTGQFDTWMKFGGEQGIVRSKYSSYQKVVNQPRIITIRAKLTPLDLYGLDFSKPVYIGQFGRIFAIYSVETGEDGICDCRLLKLNADGVVPPIFYIRLNGKNADQSNSIIPGGGASVSYRVESNGTPYVVSQDSRLTATLETSSDGTMTLSIVVPKNAAQQSVVYDPVVLGIRENRTLRRRVDLSQQGTVFYLEVNGLRVDSSIAVKAAATKIYVGYNTNGTLLVSSLGDVIASTEIDSSRIYIQTRTNTSSKIRSGAVTVTLEEAPEIQRRVLIMQAAGTPRKVFIDTGVVPSLAGTSIDVGFELIRDGATGEHPANVDDSDTIRLSFEDIAGYLGVSSLEDYIGDTLLVYISHTSGALSGQAPIPATGNIYITLENV